MNAKDRKPASRRLARHEVELWRQVTRHVKPMPGKNVPAADPEAGPAQPVAPAAKPAPAPTVRMQSPHVKPLAPLEHRLLRKLSRGSSDPEARIDLHGMRQAEAHHRLRQFLQRAYADGLSLTLVVTGKGSVGAPDAIFDERGVLRRMLPHWLAAPDLRHIVLGFTEAARRHGGGGAFYVRLRAPGSRGAGRSP